MRVLVIIPAYNEEKNILKTVNSIKALKSKKYDIDYVVINDGSTDNTEEVLTSNNLNHVRLIRNLGIGGAVQTGYLYAYQKDYDIAIQFDGDGQHDSSYIEKLCDKIAEGNDLVIGSRYLEKDKSEFQSTFMRRLGNRILSFLIFCFSGKRVTDSTSGFRACNKKVIELFQKEYPLDYPEPESIMYALNRKTVISEIPVNMHEREGGKSSITPFKSIYFMIKVSFAIMIEGISFKGYRGK